MVRRSIGLFSGFALMFIGLSVIFYTIRGMNEVKTESNNIKLSLITASPGLVSVFVGAFLIAFSISNKIPFLATVINPVSYTHLDVYKRQLYSDCFFAGQAIDGFKRLCKSFI